ncbi:MAG: transglycosylase SLT domain-containing protein [Gemmatimonadota bacterium]|nr:transglycosylase SLT domain-containing protein [Gemmatimonadota bacterium]
MDPQQDLSAERRARGDRREDGGEGGRRGGGKKPTPLAYILRSIGLIVVLLLVIIYTVMNTRPIYSTGGTLGDELRKHAPGVATAINGNDTSHIAQLMASPKFQEEKRNFYEDVMRLKQVDSARADSIAQFAVREAYVRGISPAIIFGVMLTENSHFISNAKSNVGAVGLMQVYPKIWLTKELGTLFGRDLASDSTNVKYGVFILSQYFRPRDKSGQTKERDWQTALLRYNGCVHGTNTPRCHTYPDKVQKFVEGSAKSICDGRGFYDCIAKPFITGLFGKTNGTQQASKTTTSVSTGNVAPVSGPAVDSTPSPAAPAPAAVAIPVPVAKKTTPAKTPKSSSRTSAKNAATKRATHKAASTSSRKKAKTSHKASTGKKIPPPPGRINLHVRLP